MNLINLRGCGICAVFAYIGFSFILSVYAAYEDSIKLHFRFLGYIDRYSDASVCEVVINIKYRSMRRVSIYIPYACILIGST